MRQRVFIKLRVCIGIFFIISSANNSVSIHRITKPINFHKFTSRNLIWNWVGFIFFFTSGFAQNYGCTDTLRSVNISSPFLKAGEKYFSATTYDNGVVLFQNLLQTPKGIIIIKSGLGSLPGWSKRVNQNANSGWNKISELDDHTLLISTPHFPGSGNNLVIDKLLLDSMGNILYCLGYSNQMADSGMQFVNAGNTGNIITAGLRTSNNGGGLVVESFDYSMDEENWNHNYLAPELNKLSLSPGRIWKSGNNIYIAGTYATKEPLVGGVWGLKLDYKTGRIISFNTLELHNTIASTDSIVPVGVPEIQNLTNGESVFSFKLNSNPGENAFVYVKLDSSFNLTAAACLHIPVMLNDVAMISVNKSGSAVFASIHPALASASVSFFDRASNGISQLYQYHGAADYSAVQLNFNINDQLKTFIPILQAGGLSFQILVTYPGLQSSGMNCVDVKDSVFVAPVSLSYKTASINWYSSGFDIAPITSVTILPFTETTFSSSELCETETYCDSLILSGPSALCINDSSYTFKATRNGSCVKPLLWTTDEAFSKLIPGPSGSVITLKAIKPGLTYIKVNSVGCGLSDSISVYINAKPVVDLGNDTIVCDKNTTMLKSSGFQQYLWQDGSIDSVHVVSHEGKYSLLATDFCGNQSRDTINIKFIGCVNRFSMPSAFTPNADGKNDIMRPIIQGNIEKYHFEIYNRWGQLVFQSDNPTAGWDGNIRSARQTNGSFVWFCQFQFSGEKEIQKSGTCMLIR